MKFVGAKKGNTTNFSPSSFVVVGSRMDKNQDPGPTSPIRNTVNLTLLHFLRPTTSVADPDPGSGMNNLDFLELRNHFFCFFGG
jgi:hypothetical protein